MEDLINYILSKNLLTKNDTQEDCYQITMSLISGPLEEVKYLSQLVYLELQK